MSGGPTEVGWGDWTQVHRQLERVGVYSQSQRPGWTSVRGDLLKGESQGRDYLRILSKLT